MLDLIIVGTGATGLTASMFASLYKINHKIFGEVIGGQIVEASLIENYPGFKSIKGNELTALFVEQAEGHGSSIDQHRVVSLSKDADVFTVTFKDGCAEGAKTVLLATGALHRALNVPGESDYLGRGVSYSPTVDAPSCVGKVAAIVGGGDSAFSAALSLSKVAKLVYLVHRSKEFKAKPIKVEKAKDKENIEIITENQLVMVGGGEVVEWVELAKPLARHSESKTKNHEDSGPVTNVQDDNKLMVQKLFICVGRVPAVSLAVGAGAKVDKQGYITVGPDLSTNVPGLYAAGDIALQPGGIVFRQIVTSAGEGALATAAIHQYLSGKPPAPNWS